MIVVEGGRKTWYSCGYSSQSSWLNKGATTSGGHAFVTNILLARGKRPLVSVSVSASLC
jgi:hypothetical protein